MLRFLKAGAILAVLFCLAGAVAVADPVPLQEVERSTTTVDGWWELTVKLEGMSINSVPNMAATAFTREGFLSGTARGIITRMNSTGKFPPLTAQGGQLSLFAQVGCQVDLSLGDYLEFIPTFGISPSVGASLTPGSPTPISTNIGAIPNAAITPEIEVNLKPGNITQQTLGQIPITPDTNESTLGLDRVVHVQEAQIHVDGCGGPVSVRLRATALIQTTHSVDSIDAYSDILSL